MLKYPENMDVLLYCTENGTLLSLFLTCRTPFLGGFQIHFFQGTFVRQNNFAVSSTATINCFPPLSVFFKTRYCAGSSLLHPFATCSFSSKVQMANMVSLAITECPGFFPLCQVLVMVSKNKKNYCPIEEIACWC